MHIRFIRTDKMGRTMAIEKSWSGMRKYLEKEMLVDFLQEHGNYFKRIINFKDFGHNFFTMYC